MDHENGHSPRQVYDPANGVDPDADPDAGGAEGDAVPATGPRGSSDADQESETADETGSQD